MPTLYKFRITLLPRCLSIQLQPLRDKWGGKTYLLFTSAPKHHRLREPSNGKLFCINQQHASMHQLTSMRSCAPTPWGDRCNDKEPQTVPAVQAHVLVQGPALGTPSVSHQVSVEWQQRMSPSCRCPTEPERSHHDPWHTGWSLAAGLPTASQNHRRTLHAAGLPSDPCHQSCPPLHPSCSTHKYTHSFVVQRTHLPGVNPEYVGYPRKNCLNSCWDFDIQPDIPDTWYWLGRISALPNIQYITTACGF